MYIIAWSMPYAKITEPRKQQLKAEISHNIKEF